MPGRLQGKVAVVVGGTGGFGTTTCQLFASEGAKIVIASRREAVARKAAETVGGTAICCDITDDNQVAELADRVMKLHGKIDIGINYAGHAMVGHISETGPEQIMPIVQVLFVGALSVIRHLCNAMAEGGSGSMISNSSIAAQNPEKGLAAYAGAKRALEYATRIAALEYGSKNVRVNCMAPNLTKTPMTASMFTNRLGMEAFRMQTPLGRMGHTEDIANCALYLASEESAYVSGQTIRVDGGASTQKIPTSDDMAILAKARPDLLEGNQ